MTCFKWPHSTLPWILVVLLSASAGFVLAQGEAENGTGGQLGQDPAAPQATAPPPPPVCNQKVIQVARNICESRRQLVLRCKQAGAVSIEPIGCA